MKIYKVKSFSRLTCSAKFRAAVFCSASAAMQSLICSLVSLLQNMALLSLLLQKLCCFKQCIFAAFCLQCHYKLFLLVGRKTDR
jgi:hypothetical protein